MASVKQESARKSIYATDVSDAAWALLAPLLPAAQPGGQPRTTDIRAVINAIFYLLRTGCQWRLLPRDFPAWGTVYYYFRMWKSSGVWTCLQRAIYEQTAGKPAGPRAPWWSHGRAIGEDDRTRRRSWLRWTQTRERAQALHPCRYLGPADWLSSRAGQHLGPTGSLPLTRWLEPLVSRHPHYHRGCQP